MRTCLHALLLLAALAAPASAQFHLFDWTLQDDVGNGIASLTHDEIFLSPTFGGGGGTLLVYRAFSPVAATIDVHMQYMTFDGACNKSVPVWIVDGQVTILASCSTSAPLELHVPAGSQFALGLQTFDPTWPGLVHFTGFDYTPDVPQGGWADLGQGLAGVAGVPALAGVSLLYPHFPFTLELSAAKPSAPATLVVGLGQLGAPFKGGVMVPQPDLLLPVLTDALGRVTLSTHVPGGLAPGLELDLQVWLADAAGVAGFAASNAVAATLP